MKLWDYLTESVSCNPDQVLWEGGRKITVGQLFLSAEKLSLKLKYNKYGILCSSLINSAIAILACIARGATAVPLSGNYGKYFNYEVIKQMRISAIITDTETGSIQITDIVKKENNECKYDLIDDYSGAFILCTSGSTGNPKGVVLSEDAVISNLSDTKRFYNLTPQDRVLANRGLFHCTSIIGELLVSLVCGASVYFYSGEFSPEIILRLMSQLHITFYAGTPTIFSCLAYAAEKYQEQLYLKRASVGGEIMTDKVRRQLLDVFSNVEFIHSYGLTETCSRATYRILDYSKEAECVGKPLFSLEMIIADKEGNQRSCGEVGELYIKGKNLFYGYYRDKWKTDNAFDNGWFKTGDLAWADKDGDYYIVSRMDNMIIRGGVNIYPEIIENIFLSDKNVRQAVIYGDKESKVTECIVALIVLHYKENTDVIKVRLRKKCLEELGIHCVPDVIKIVDEISCSNCGKVIRN